ncbi:response regulator [Candidatus Saccharibacteria bacterium]|nr:response regulator [Candidatus Saccharibacteria bacterium]
MTAPLKIFIIDDDELFADCVKTAICSAYEIPETPQGPLSVKKPVPKSSKNSSKSLEVKTYKNALDAINNLGDPLPDLIFLDILLPGPDGFTFLNELVSYPDTAKIPVILLTSLDLADFDLKLYGVKGILNKEKMKPEDIVYYVKRYTN